MPASTHASFHSSQLPLMPASTHASLPLMPASTHANLPFNQTFHPYQPSPCQTSTHPNLPPIRAPTISRDSLQKVDNTLVHKQNFVLLIYLLTFPFNQTFHSCQPSTHANLPSCQPSTHAVLDLLRVEGLTPSGASQPPSFHWPPTGLFKIYIKNTLLTPSGFTTNRVLHPWKPSTHPNLPPVQTFHPSQPSTHPNLPPIPTFHPSQPSTHPNLPPVQTFHPSLPSPHPNLPPIPTFPPCQPSTHPNLPPIQTFHPSQSSSQTFHATRPHIHPHNHSLASFKPVPTCLTVIRKNKIRECIFFVTPTYSICLFKLL